MKRKTMNAIIALVLIASYAVSLAAAFYMNKGYIDSIFFTMVGQDFEVEDYDKNIDGYVERIYNYFTLHNAYNIEVPVCIIAYDDEGNIVSKINNGPKARLKFNYVVADDDGSEEEIPDLVLDNYLNEKAVQEINSSIQSTYFKDIDSLYVSRFEYCTIDGEMVPVNLYLSDRYGDMSERKIKLTDYPVEETQYGFGLIEDGMDPMELVLSGFAVQPYNNDIFEIFRENVFNTETLDDLLESNRWFYSTSYSYFVTVGSNDYKVEIYFAFKSAQTTLHSDDFLSSVLNITLVFICLCIAAFVLFNMVYRRSQRLDKAQLAFTAAAAHELKTPLAIIQNQCEFIMDGVAPEKNEEYIRSIYDESLRMNRLVANMLQYNRLALAGKIEKHSVPFSEIAYAEFEKYKPLAEARGVVFDCDITDGITAKANADLIALVIDNFISNAVKHTEQGKRVVLMLTKTGLSVMNEGEPISAEYGKKLWDIFYQTDKARTKNDDGSTGMGLAICKQILRLHKYHYGYRNLNNGVEFYFRFN